MTAMHRTSAESSPNSPRLAKATGNPRLPPRPVPFRNPAYGRQPRDIAFPNLGGPPFSLTESPRRQILLAAIINQAPYSIPIGIRSGSVH